MGKSSKKPYVVRGFNVTEEQKFDCTGVITKMDTFTEVTVDTQHEAVVEMLTNSNLATMSARKVSSTSSAAVPDGIRELYVIDLTVVTTDQRAKDLRQCRTPIREALKTWAEKCRIRGTRGWRVNAIKTPTFEFDKKEGSVVIRTQVVLGTAIFYNDDAVKIHDPEMAEAGEEDSLRSLAHVLARACPSFASMKYRHSVIGTGEIF